MTLYRWIRNEDGTVSPNNCLPSSHASADKQGWPLWMARGLQHTCNVLNASSTGVHYVGTKDGTPIDVPMHDLNGQTVDTDPTFMAWRRSLGDKMVIYRMVDNKYIPQDY